MTQMLLLTAVVFAAAPQPSDARGSEYRVEAELDRAAVAAALKEIEKPCLRKPPYTGLSKGNGFNAPAIDVRAAEAEPYCPTMLDILWRQWKEDDRPEASNLLAKTHAQVDESLLRLASEHKEPAARCRACWLLIRRGNLEVIPVLEKLAASGDHDAREFAWWAYGAALRGRHLPPPLDFTFALECYRKKNRDVRGALTRFLGDARARPAVPVLIAALKTDLLDSDEEEEIPADKRGGRLPLPRPIASNSDAVVALANIGDSRAASAIIDAARVALETGKGNHDLYLSALGQLPTDEAVDYLITHMDERAALRGLLKSGNRRALPALKKHLAEIEKTVKEEDSYLAEVRVAVVRLSHKDPTDALLKHAEDPNEGVWMRWECLRALRDYDVTPLAARILDLYKSAPDTMISRPCLWLLKNQKLEGITAAMTEHALGLQNKQGLEDYIIEVELLGVLNRRLKTTFPTFAELDAHLRSERGLPPKTED